jgi:hypothetical protein
MDVELKASPSGRPRRWAEGLLFVSAWMALGFGLRLDANSYLLIGIPLTLAFQILIRRAPLRSLWVREAPRARPGFLIVGAVLAILPAFLLIAAALTRQWSVAGWCASAVAGAFAAGYALREFRRETWRALAFCLLTAGTIGIAQMVLARSARGIHRHPDLVAGLRDLALYFPVCFLLEEVSFRGALDSHLYRPGDRLRILSAVVGSAVWGLWHLPMLGPEGQGVATAFLLAVVHTLVGVPLAISWRKGGNLAVPAFVHALIDAVRNAIGVAG